MSRCTPSGKRVGLHCTSSIRKRLAQMEQALLLRTCAQHARKGISTFWHVAGLLSIEGNRIMSMCPPGMVAYGQASIKEDSWVLLTCKT